MTSLIICPSRSSLTQALALVESLRDERFVLYSGYYPKSFNNQVIGQKNLILLKTFSEVVSRIWQFDRLITFGCTARPPHVDAFCASLIFHRLGRQRYDIQHGLIQEGYNEIIDGVFTDEAIFCDLKFPMNVYGSLLKPSRSHKSRSGLKKKVGITSNLHWSAYSDCERGLFYRSVLEICRQNPNKDFLWRPHPAEFLIRKGVEPRFNDFGIEASNLRILGYNEIDTTGSEDFMETIDILFTSVSTTMLEAELAGIPCVTFPAKSLSAVLASFARVDCVQTPMKVAGAFKELFAGTMNPGFDSGIGPFNISAFCHAVGFGDPVAKTRNLSREEETLTAWNIASLVKRDAA